MQFCQLFQRIYSTCYRYTIYNRVAAHSDRKILHPSLVFHFIMHKDMHNIVNWTNIF